MPTTTVRQPLSPIVQHPKAKIVSADNPKRSVTLAYAPTGGEVGGMGWDWVPAERPGRKPLLLRGGSRLRTLRYTVRLLHIDTQRSVEPTIEALRGMADAAERVRMTGMGPQERGLYRMAIESITILARQQGSNAATEAEVSLLLTEASDAVTKLGPLTGGAPAGNRPAQTPGVPAQTGGVNSGRGRSDPLTDVLQGR